MRVCRALMRVATLPRMRNIIIVALLTLTAAFAFAAEPSAEMRKLDFMLGDWSGDSSIQMGPGKPQHAFVTESIRSKAGVILIEGLGRRRNEDGSIGDVVHDALGVISWDPVKAAYRFSAYTAAQGAVDATFIVGDKSATWSFDTPTGQKIRYSIHLTEKGEWNEVGEFSPDGTKWVKFFEMTLKKK